MGSAFTFPVLSPERATFFCVGGRAREVFNPQQSAHESFGPGTTGKAGVAGEGCFGLSCSRSRIGRRGRVAGEGSAL